MVLELKLTKTGIKPIFNLVVSNIVDEVNALFDTGSTKVIWCSSSIDISDTKFEVTNETTTLSGFGTGEQTGCKIYKGSFSIYRTGRGITFRDVEVVESTKKIAAFDMILPYALFHEFEYTFKPTSLDAKFGKLVIDTLSNKVVHRVKSYGGVVAEVYAEEEDKVDKSMDVALAASGMEKSVEDIEEERIRKKTEEIMKEMGLA